MTAPAIGRSGGALCPGLDVDPDLSEGQDALVPVDLARSDPRTLGRDMGPSETAYRRANQGIPPVA